MQMLGKWVQKSLGPKKVCVVLLGTAEQRCSSAGDWRPFRAGHVAMQPPLNTKRK